MIQYLFKKYEAFLYHKNSSPLQPLHFWYKKKPTCFYMAKTLRGNRLQDKGTIIRGLSVLSWSHISLISNI